MDSLAHCIHQGQMGLLSTRTQHLRSLTRQVYSVLPRQLQGKCHVASYTKGSLILIVEQGSWSFYLQCDRVTLLKSLKKLSVFYDIRDVKLRFVPSGSLSSADMLRSKHTIAPKSVKRIPHQAVKHLIDIAHGIDQDSKLPSVLIRMAKRHLEW